MSVLIIGKFRGDNDQFRQALTDRADEQAFIGSVGAPPAPPEITITEAVTSADQF